MLNSFSRAKSALIMLLKDMIILYLPDKQTNITKPVNSDFMILFYLCLRKCDFELPRLDTVAHGRHLLRYQGPFIWSKVSSELRNLTSLKAFKKHIFLSSLSSIGKKKVKVKKSSPKSPLANCQPTVSQQYTNN